jgi:hypothetical protein
MKHLPFLAVTGLLAAGVIASAQYPRAYGDRFYDRGDYNRSGGYLFNRVRSDLDRAEANSWGADRRKFGKVREELNEFQRTGSRHELDDTIGALQKVVNDRRLANRERDVLAQDLYQLRDFRARNGLR